MEAVFPKNLDPVSRLDTRSAISTLEDYIRYMQERIEYVTTILSGKTGLLGLSKRIDGLEMRTTVIFGAADPDSSTVGLIGSLFVNTTAGTVFICTSTSPYSWLAI